MMMMTNKNMSVNTLLCSVASGEDSNDSGNSSWENCSDTASVQGDGFSSSLSPYLQIFASSDPVSFLDSQTAIEQGIPPKVTKPDEPSFHASIGGETLPTFEKNAQSISVSSITDNKDESDCTFDLSHYLHQPDSFYHFDQQKKYQSTAPESKKEKNLPLDVSIAGTQSPSSEDASRSDNLLSNTPYLEIIEEPQEFKQVVFSFIDVKFNFGQVVGYVGKVVLTVILVTTDGKPHIHTLNGKGCTDIDCQHVKLAQDMLGIQMVLGPEQNMTATWDGLSICRKCHWEVKKMAKQLDQDPRVMKEKYKNARLLFQATIPPSDDHDGYTLACQSRSFRCTEPSAGPEVLWCSSSEGPSAGGQEIGIIGKKFTSSCKIRFYNSTESWEAFAKIDKEKSHNGACVVVVPKYKDGLIDSPMEVNVEVKVEKGRKCNFSDPWRYTYLPQKQTQQAILQDSTPEKRKSECESTDGPLPKLLKDELQPQTSQLLQLQLPVPALQHYQQQQPQQKQQQQPHLMLLQIPQTQPRTHSVQQQIQPSQPTQVQSGQQTATPCISSYQTDCSVNVSNANNMHALTKQWLTSVQNVSQDYNYNNITFGQPI